MKPEGIWQCDGCGRTFPEYINGCTEDHPAPRKVRLAIPEEANPTEHNDTTQCAGCFTIGHHAPGCPTGANGPPNYD
jgi:hypothetical protein